MTQGIAVVWGLLVWANWVRWNASGPEADVIRICREALALIPHLSPVAALRAWGGHLVELVLLGLLAAAAHGAGRPALAWLGLRRTPVRGVFESVALGAALGGCISMGVGFAGLSFPPIAWVVTIGLACYGVRSIGRLPVRTIHVRGIRWATVAVVIAVLIPLCGAVAPETSIDAQLHHLAQPAFFASIHKIIALPWNEFSWHPALAHTGFLHAHLLGGPAIAKLISYGWFLLLTLLVADWAREHLDRRWALCAAAGFALLPYVQLLAMRAYPDFATVAYTAIMLRNLSSSRRTLRWTGLWAGLAAATKLTGLLAPAVGMLAMLMLRAPGRAWTWSGIAALAAILPWMLRNMLASGNPVAPLLPNLLPTLWWDPASVARHLRDLAPMATEPMALPGIFAVLERAWNATIRNTGVLDPMAGVGAWFFWLLPVLALTRTPAGRIGGMVLLALVIWNFMPRLVRYAMPVWPAMAVASAVALHVTARSGAGGSVLAAAGAVLLAFHIPLGIARQHRVANPVAVACGAEPVDRYLARGFPEGGRTLVIRDSIAAHQGSQRVLMLTPTGLWLTLGPGMVYQTLFDEPLIVRLAKSSRTSDEIVKRLRQMRIGFTLYQPAAGFSLHRKYRTWEFDDGAAARWRACWESRAEPVLAAGDRFVVHRLAEQDGESHQATLPGLDEQWLADTLGGDPAALQGIAESRNTAAAWEHLGAARLNRGDEVGALVAFLKSKSLGRRTVATLASVGFLNARRGNMTEAAVCLREALEIDPDRADVRTTLEQVLAASGRR